MDAVLAQAVADAAGRQHRSPGLTVVMYNRQQNCQIYSGQSPQQLRRAREARLSFILDRVKALQIRRT
jgi:hypothetical protein